MEIRGERAVPKRTTSRIRKPLYRRLEAALSFPRGEIAISLSPRAAFAHARAELATQRDRVRPYPGRSRFRFPARPRFRENFPEIGISHLTSDVSQRYCWQQFCWKTSDAEESRWKAGARRHDAWLHSGTRNRPACRAHAATAQSRRRGRQYSRRFGETLEGARAGVSPSRRLPAGRSPNPGAIGPQASENRIDESS